MEYNIVSSKHRNIVLQSFFKRLFSSIVINPYNLLDECINIYMDYCTVAVDEDILKRECTDYLIEHNYIPSLKTRVSKFTYDSLFNIFYIQVTDEYNHSFSVGNELDTILDFDDEGLLYYVELLDATSIFNLSTEELKKIETVLCFVQINKDVINLKITLFNKKDEKISEYNYINLKEEKCKVGKYMLI